MFSVFAAGNALHKLHSVGQPLLGIVTESIFAATAISLLNYVRKHIDRDIHLPKWFGGQE
jgi:hypothetical protein